MISVSAWTLLVALGAGGETVLLDFTAPWCAPCRSMEPVIHRLQNEGYPIRQVNIDQNPGLAAQFRVNSVPCFIMLADGREVDRVEGAVGHDRLARMFSAARFAMATHADETVPAAAIRGQSPDRFGLGGRLRQMVGGRRGESNAPPQPPATPPTDSGGESASYSAPSDDGGPQPPAVLGELAPAAYGDPAPSPRVPEMAAAFNAAQPANPAGSTPTQLWAPSPTATAPPAATSSPEDRAMAASVRLRIDDGQFYSYATGTMIAVRPEGEGLILTCGHVFRESQGRGEIAVDFFGPYRQAAVPGRLLAYDLNHDLGLVSVRVPPGAPIVPLAGRETYVREGQRVFSVGCDRGAEPGLREGRIAGVNRYLGTPNLVVTGRPVVGRSGGGLFDAEGRLIGVCRAGDMHVDEGVYVSFQAVHAQLEHWGVRDVLAAPSQPAALAAQPMAPPGAPAVVAPLESPASYAAPLAADRPADFDYTQPHGSTDPTDPLAAGPAGYNSSAPPTLSEPVYVIRAGGPSSGEVILLEQPSRAFLDQLAREAKAPISGAAELPAAVRAVVETAGLAPVPNGPLVRGQSPRQLPAGTAPSGFIR